MSVMNCVTKMSYIVLELELGPNLGSNSKFEPDFRPEVKSRDGFEPRLEVIKVKARAQSSVIDQNHT